jgi:hypothetical protein
MTDLVQQDDISKCNLQLCLIGLPGRPPLAQLPLDVADVRKCDHTIKSDSSLQLLVCPQLSDDGTRVGQTWRDRRQQRLWSVSAPNQNVEQLDAAKWGGGAAQSIHLSALARVGR